MKTTQIILIIVMIALSSCSRRTTSLLKANAIGNPEPFAEQEPVEVETVDSEDDNNGSNASNGQQDQNNSGSSSNGGSSNQSGSDQSSTTTTTTTTTTTAPAAVIKRPVYRAVHPYYGNSYWTASQANLAVVAANYGFVSQGHAFNTAMHITADCQVPLYSCSNPTIGHFIYHSADCGGSANSQLEFLGYACQSGNIPTVPLYGMRTDSGYVYYTTSLAEVNLVQRYGYYVVGAYYTPQ